jgi:hypothetical protein
LGNNRATLNTGSATLTPLAPPFAIGEDEGNIEMTWKTSTSVTASNTVSGNTAALSFRKSATTVPLALSGHTITISDDKKPGTFIFAYKNVTGGGQEAGLTGTYTYSAYTPVMALVTMTATGGEIQYLQLYFTSSNAGEYVRADPDGSNFKSGSFSMK